METGLADNNTREKIVLALRKNGSMSISGLSKEVSVTPMGVRQHLLILESKGVVDYIPRKGRKGRPGFFYRLTDSADSLFPKAYHRLAMDILTFIEETDGREKLDRLFKRRAERIIDEKRKLLSGVHDFSGRLNSFAAMMQKDGWLVEIEENNKGFSLKIFNCPISRISASFKEACRYDLMVFKEITGKEAVRKQCIADGDSSCVYQFQKGRKTLSA